MHPGCRSCSSAAATGRARGSVLSLPPSLPQPGGRLTLTQGLPRPRAQGPSPFVGLNCGQSPRGRGHHPPDRPDSRAGPAGVPHPLQRGQRRPHPRPRASSGPEAIRQEQPFDGSAARSPRGRRSLPLQSPRHREAARLAQVTQPGVGERVQSRPSRRRFSGAAGGWVS